MGFGLRALFERTFGPCVLSLSDRVQDAIEEAELELAAAGASIEVLQERLKDAERIQAVQAARVSILRDALAYIEEGESLTTDTEEELCKCGLTTTTTSAT